MLKNVVKIRVRYAETDQMSFVYYGNYAQYFEVSRVELLREIGLSYKSMEEQGIMMPVLEMTIKYIKPAKYDDLLHIEITVEKIEGSRIYFSYETYNEEQVLLNKASTTLVFVDTKTGRPTTCPDLLLEKLSG